MKKLLSLLMVLALSLSTCTSAFADTSSSSDDGCPEGWTVFGEGVYASDEMTFEETVEYYAEDNGISLAEAREKLEKIESQNRGAIQTASSSSLTRRVLSVDLNVTSTYKPKIKFLVYTSDWNNYWVIKSIYHTYIGREYNGISKQYNGELKVWYRGNNKIEYLVNGDFYNNGTTTITQEASGSFGIDDLARATYKASITSSSNHYKYVDIHDTKSYRGNGQI